MSSDSAKTRTDILTSAKKEFLEYGFSNASLRRIAAGAKVTTGALYRHFKDKEALFDALVAPVYNEFLDYYHQESQKQFEQLKQEGMAPMWASSTAAMGRLIDYIYDHFDAFKLLVSCSEQSPYETFTHALVALDVHFTSQYLELAKKAGYPVRPVTRRELHLAVSAQMACVLELIIHNVPYQETMAILPNISRFIVAGWNSLLMEHPL